MTFLLSISFWSILCFTQHYALGSISHVLCNSSQSLLMAAHYSGRVIIGLESFPMTGTLVQGSLFTCMGVSLGCVQGVGLAYLQSSHMLISLVLLPRSLQISPINATTGAWMTHFYTSFLSFGQILDFVKYVAHQVRYFSEFPFFYYWKSWGPFNVLISYSDFLYHEFPIYSVLRDATKFLLVIQRPPTFWKLIIFSFLIGSQWAQQVVPVIFLLK